MYFKGRRPRNGDGRPLFGVRNKENKCLANKAEKSKAKNSRNSTRKKYEKAIFQHDLQQIDWETILTPFANDPSAMAGTFQEIFESLLNIHAPIKKRRVRSEFAPWLTPNIRKSMETRDRLKKNSDKIS